MTAKKKRRVGTQIITSDKEYGERAAFDEYPTPIDLVRAILGLVCYEPHYILDVGAGSGVWGQAARELWPNARIDGDEIRPVKKPVWYDHWSHDDYLKMSRWWPWRYDLVMGNPPYGKDADDKIDRTIAERFVRKAYEDAQNGCNVVFLMLQAFLETRTRYDSLWRECPPSRVYTLAERPSFLGNGHTDARAYMAICWRKGYLPPVEMLTGMPQVMLSWLAWKGDEKPPSIHRYPKPYYVT